MLQTVGYLAEAQSLQPDAEFLSHVVVVSVTEKHREMAKAMLRKKGVLSGAVRQQPKPGAVRSEFMSFSSRMALMVIFSGLARMQGET